MQLGQWCTRSLQSDMQQGTNPKGPTKTHQKHTQIQVLDPA